MTARLPYLRPGIRARVIDWLDEAALDAAGEHFPDVDLASAFFALADALRRQPNRQHHRAVHTAHQPQRSTQ